MAIYVPGLATGGPVLHCLRTFNLEHLVRLIIKLLHICTDHDKAEGQIPQPRDATSGNYGAQLEGQTKGRGESLRPLEEDGL